MKRRRYVGEAGACRTRARRLSGRLDIAAIVRQHRDELERQARLSCVAMVLTLSSAVAAVPAMSRSAAPAAASTLNSRCNRPAQSVAYAAQRVCSTKHFQGSQCPAKRPHEVQPKPFGALFDARYTHSLELGDRRAATLASPLCFTRDARPVFTPHIHARRLRAAYSTRPPAPASSKYLFPVVRALPGQDPLRYCHMQREFEDSTTSEIRLDRL